MIVRYLFSQRVIFLSSEAVVPRCSVKKVFLEISQNAQKNTRTRVSFLIKLQAGLLLSFLNRDIGPNVD